MKTEGNNTILIASSDALQRSVIAKYLRECGYRLIEAGSVAEAKLAFEHHPIDIVVADASLRDGTGFDLSSYVRTHMLDAEVVLTQSVVKTAQIAGDLCEEGPLDQPYHPQHLVDEIKRLRAGRS